MRMQKNQKILPNHIERDTYSVNKNSIILLDNFQYFVMLPFFDN